MTDSNRVGCTDQMTSKAEEAEAAAAQATEKAAKAEQELEQAQARVGTLETELQAVVLEVDAVKASEERALSQVGHMTNLEWFSALRSQPCLFAHFILFISVILFIISFSFFLMLCSFQ